MPLRVKAMDYDNDIVLTTLFSQRLIVQQCNSSDQNVIIRTRGPPSLECTSGVKVR